LGVLTLSIMISHELQYKVPNGNNNNELIESIKKLIRNDTVPLLLRYLILSVLMQLHRLFLDSVLYKQYHTFLQKIQTNVNIRLT
jgi:hypothetical protein